MYKTFKQSMKVQYRIKNDLIGLDWKIYRKYGVPENFNDPNIITESIILEIRHRQVKGVIIDRPFIFVDDNIIKIDFKADEQSITGDYDLFLQYKAIEDGIERTFTLDKPYAFELVKSSAFINVPEDRLIYEGILEAFEGLSAYEVALKNGFEGTEREWLESLAISGDSIYMMDRDDIVFKNDLPTKVSELENDKGYLTEHQDLSNLATKSELPTKVSELINDSEYLTEHQSLDGYATEQYVDNKINNIPEVDLSEYAKRNELFDKDYNKLINKPDLSIYLTEHQSLTEYAKKTEIPSLDNYATKPFVIDEINKINLFSGNYNDLSNKPNLSIYLTEHQSLSHLATRNELNAKADKIDLFSKNYNDLTNKPRIPNIVADLFDGADYAKKTDLFSGRYSDLKNKPDLSIYLTEHQDISHLATKSEIPSLEGLIYKSEVMSDYVPKTLQIAGNKLNKDVSVEDIKTAIGNATISNNGLLSSEDKVRLNTLAELLNDEDGEFVDTLQEILSIFSRYPEGLDIIEKFSEKVDKVEGKGLSTNDFTNELKSNYDSAYNKSLIEYALKEHTHNQYLTEHQDISNLALKSEIPSIAGLASEQYVDNKIDNLDIPEVDLSNYAKKSELFDKDYNKLNNKPNIPSIEGLATESYVDNKVANVEVDLTDYALKSELFNKDYNELNNKPNLDIYLTEHQDISHLASKDEIPNINGLASESFVIAKIEDIDIPTNTSELINDSGFIDDISHLASKVYVDNEIANIDIPEVDLTDYAKKDEIPNTDNFVTKDYIDDLFGELNDLLIDINGEEI